MLALHRFCWDCGRGGYLEGLFVAKEEEVEALIGKHVYFGEVLGKHSEVQGVVGEGDIVTLTTDQAFIKKLVEVLFHGGIEITVDALHKTGCCTISGYNPLVYYEPEEDE